MIRKDKVGITACSLANCCLTLVEQPNPNLLSFSNEKGEKLTFLKEEFEEMVNYLQSQGILART